MEEKKTVDQDEIRIDLSTLLGFDQIQPSEAAAATLLDDLDAVHNKIGELPPPPP